jgi:hypothetical protein
MANEIRNNLLENSGSAKRAAPSSGPSGVQKLRRLNITGAARRVEPDAEMERRFQEFLAQPSPDFSPRKTRAGGPATYGSGAQTPADLQAIINAALGRKRRALAGSSQSQQALKDLRALWREAVKRGWAGKIKMPDGYKQ